MVTFAEASRACCLAWGQPTAGYRNREADEHPAYVAMRWELARATAVELHEESPGVAADLDVYLVARYWPQDGDAECEEWALCGTHSPTDTDPLTPLPEAISAAVRWMRERGVAMPTAEPYDADDIEWVVNS